MHSSFVFEMTLIARGSNSPLLELDVCMPSNSTVTTPDVSETAPTLDERLNSIFDQEL
jgi:hypothetical protein